MFLVSQIAKPELQTNLPEFQEGICIYEGMDLCKEEFCENLCDGRTATPNYNHYEKK